jgi:hypothetical protein
MERKYQSAGTELDARACSSSYLILGSIWAIPAIVATSLLRSGRMEDWSFVYIASGVLLVMLLWLRTFRLKYSDGQLSYRTLFSGTRSISLSDIEKAETQLIGTSKGQVRVLMIYLQPERMEKPMRVNMKVFSKADLGRIFDLLGSKFKSSRRIGVYSDDNA